MVYNHYGLNCINALVMKIYAGDYLKSEIFKVNAPWV